MYAYMLSGNATEFSCFQPNPFDKFGPDGSFEATCVKVIGQGSLEVNNVCFTSSLPGTSFVDMYESIGYGNFTCNLNARSYTTCDCEVNGTTPSCQNFSPP
eukprot:347948-Chlamydomonas_euryale.AAC.1